MKLDTMSIRNFKQLFSVVFAFILAGLLITLGLNLHPLITSLPPSLAKDSFLQLTSDSPLYSRGIVGAMAILGLLLGVIFGPKLAQRLVNAGNAIEGMSTKDKISVGVGTLLGLLVTLPFCALLLMLRTPIFSIPLSILLGVA